VEELGAGIKAGAGRERGMKCHFVFIYRVTTLKAAVVVVVVFGGTYVHDKSKHMKLVRTAIEFLPSAGGCMGTRTASSLLITLI